MLIVLFHITTTNYLDRGQKYAKLGELCVKKFKILIFDKFSDFECLKMYDEANNESIKRIRSNDTSNYQTEKRYHS